MTHCTVNIVYWKDVERALATLINGNATVEAAVRSSSLTVQVDQMKAMQHNI